MKGLTIVDLLYRLLRDDFFFFGMMVMMVSSEWLTKERQLALLPPILRILIIENL